MADLTTKAINTYGLNDETLGLGHKVLVVGDSAEYLTLVSDIAKKIVEDYAGSTLLGTAQSVADAFGKTYNLGIATDISNNADLNDYTDAGTFKTSGNATAATLSSCPVTGITFKMTVEKIYSSNGIIQSLTAFNNPPRHFERRGLYSSSAWTFSEWLQVPTRAEMDAATNKVSAIVGMSDPGSMTSYSTQQFTVASSSRHLIVTSGAKADVHGLCIVSANSSGAVQLSTVYVGSGLTITAPSNNVLQVENTSNVACYFTDICTNGTAITKVTESTNSAQNESI